MLTTVNTFAVQCLSVFIKKDRYLRCAIERIELNERDSNLIVYYKPVIKDSRLDGLSRLTAKAPKLVRFITKTGMEIEKISLIPAQSCGIVRIWEVSHIKFLYGMAMKTPGDRDIKFSLEKKERLGALTEALFKALLEFGNCVLISVEGLIYQVRLQTYIDTNIFGGIEVEGRFLDEINWIEPKIAKQYLRSAIDNNKEIRSMMNAGDRRYSCRFIPLHGEDCCLVVFKEH